MQGDFMNSDFKFLKNTDIEQLIEKKIESEIQGEIEEAKKEKQTITIKEFDKVPKDKIFSLNTSYKVFNRKTKKESFINGVQAESLLGLNQSARNDLENKYTDNFTSNEYYVRFHIYRFE
jgi:hypothetical protein